MARIQLRDTTIYFQDGLGPAEVVVATDNQITGILSIGDGSTDVPITDPNLNTAVADQVPIGARFTLPSGPTVYTVTSRTPASGTTTDIQFTPLAVIGETALADITWLPQRLLIKIGEGDVSWSETKEYIYDRDRDELDTVRQGQDQPMSVDMAFTFEYVTASTSNPPTPADALNQDGEASEWVSSSADPCEPYAIDVVILHCVPCGTDEDQEITLPDFRNESLDFSIADASVATSGQCNATRATVVRSTHADC